MPTGNGEGCVYWDTSGYGVVRNDSMNIVFSTVDIKYIYNMSGYCTAEMFVSRILNHIGLNVGVDEIEEQPVEINPGDINIHYLSANNIRFEVYSLHPTVLQIYDISGRLVKTWNIKGYNIIDWLGTDQNGNIMSSGRYFAILKDFPTCKQIILIR